MDRSLDKLEKELAFLRKRAWCVDKLQRSSDLRASWELLYVSNGQNYYCRVVCPVCELDFFQECSATPEKMLICHHHDFRGECPGSAMQFQPLPEAVQCRLCGKTTPYNTNGYAGLVRPIPHIVKHGKTPCLNDLSFPFFIEGNLLRS